MNYKIAICDDNETDITYIAQMVHIWAENTKNIIAIQSFPSAESFLFHYAEEKDYDILLLDIEMKNINGVELAKEIRKENDAVQIIFVTGYSDYIAEGYEVSALHYLMKPVKEEKLFEIMNRATVKLQKNEKALFLTLSGETVRIPIYEIRYLEVQQNYVTIHAKEDYSIKRTLGEFEHELDERFYRMGRSYLVNLTYIQKITKTSVLLSDGSVLPLPRGQYEPLNQAFIAHT
jgi:Response regulator of the LytR/AlgR family